MFHHRATPFLLALLVLGSPFFTSSGGFRALQTQPAQQPSAATPDAPGTINGATNPELIPDDVAYRLVLLAIAEPQNPSDAQQARFRAKIGPAGLNDDDTAALLIIVVAFQKQLDALNVQVTQILARDPLPPAGSPDYQQLAGLAQQRSPVFTEATSALPARLSADGMAKLQAFVQNEKRRMKYHPDSQ